MTQSIPVDREFDPEGRGWLNPNSDPEKCGLEVVASISYNNNTYEFDDRIVWRDLASGTLWTARDSGCSCPTPFEDYKTLFSLERLTTSRAIRDEWKEQIDSGYYSGDSYDEVQGELAKIDAALAALSGEATR